MKRKINDDFPTPKSKWPKFLIIALIVLLLVVPTALYFVLKMNFDADIPNVDKSVRDCFSLVAKKSLFEVTLNSAQDNTDVYNFEGTEINWWLKDKQNKLPSKEQLQKILADKVSAELSVCLEAKKITTIDMYGIEVVISDDRTDFVLNSAKSKSLIFSNTITDIKSSIKVDLYSIFEHASTIVGLVTDTGEYTPAQDMQIEGSELTYFVEDGVMVAIITRGSVDDIPLTIAGAMEI
ncbi:hypothetical protein ACFLZN_01660 [Nanoarchaeota archaeon]